MDENLKKKDENTRTIYSNSKRSEQFLVTECFLTCSWRFLMPNKLTIIIHIRKNYWDLETCRKYKKIYLIGLEIVF